MEELLSERLKAARKYLNLSQEFVATQVDLPRTAITAIELGQRNVSTEELRRFSELYGLTLDELVYGKDTNSEVKVFMRSYSDLTEVDKMEIQNLIDYKNKIKKKNGTAP